MPQYAIRFTNQPALLFKLLSGNFPKRTTKLFPAFDSAELFYEKLAVVCIKGYYFKSDHWKFVLIK